MPRSIPRAGKLILFTIFFYTTLPSSWGHGEIITESGPDADVKQFQFSDLGARLRAMPAGPEHDYFAGVLANAENHVAESIQLLTAAWPSLRTARPDRAAIALQTLADDYTKSFQYGQAARTDDDLLTKFASYLTPEQLKGTKDDTEIMQILRDAPPQTITWNGPVKLKTERNPINSLNTNLTVNGVQGPWLLDTGANLSLVTKSFADRLGLKPLPGVAHTQAGLTGIQNELQVALLPTLQMGGASLHNMVIMILDDASMNIALGKQSYQINAVIGYPVFQALGSISFLHDGEFVAGSAAPASGAGAKMYMKSLNPIIICDVEGHDLPFTFDTGASGTDLYVRYARLFRNESKSWKKGKEKEGGAGGVVERKIYLQPELKLGIGDRTVVLKKMSIYRTGTGTDTDDLYGNIGQDVPMGFSSFTLDYTNMTFSLGDPLPPEKSTPATLVR